jgi:hypothetical protein
MDMYQSCILSFHAVGGEIIRSFQTEEKKISVSKSYNG